MPRVNLQLFPSASAKKLTVKELVYAALRKDNKQEILKILENPELQQYLVNLTPGNEEHDHVIRLLDSMLELGRHGLVCEILEKAGINSISKISSKIALCRNVPQMINIDSKLVLFHFATLTKHLRSGKDSRGGLCDDLIARIYEFVLNDSMPITAKKMELAARSYEEPRVLAFGRKKIKA